jgi:hypothetical protein
MPTNHPKKIFTLGDSFFDTNGGWGKPLCEKLGVENINCAYGGAGNKRITNAFFKSNNLIDDNTVVVVSWTDLDRVDKYISETPHLVAEFNEYEGATMVYREGWILSGFGLGSYQQKTARAMGMKLLLKSQTYENEEFSDHKRWKAYWKEYYKRYHTYEDSYCESLLHFVNVTQWLEARNIPYIMTSFSNIWENKHSKEFGYLRDNLDFSKWFYHNKLGCWEWVRKNGLPAKLGHPTEESYAKWADVFIENSNIEYLLENL